MTFGFGLGLPRGGNAAAGSPSFVANFANGSLPQGVTFSRGTTGTYYNSSGLLSTNENLLLYSSAVGQSGSWTPSGNTVLNSGIAPDGTNTATTFTATLQYNGLGQTYSSFGKSTTYTFSGYVRLVNGATSAFILQGYDGVTYQNTVITPTGVWQRFSYTFTTSASATTLILTFQDNAPSNWATYQIWGAQLQQGTQVSAYNPTTSAAVYGPRFDYNPDPWTYISQNLEPYSYSLGTNHGVAGASFVAAPSVKAPDGTYTVWKLVEDTSTGGHAATGLYAPVVGTTYYYSMYIKSAGDSRQITPLGFGAAAQGYAPICNPDTGALTGVYPAGTTFTSVGDGWYLFRMPITASSTTTIQCQLSSSGTTSYTGNGSSGAYVWGWQISTTTFYPYTATTTSAAVVNAAPLGLLVEEARTNLITYSNDLSTAPFTAKVNITVTLNAAVSPDGSSNAQKIAATATAVTNFTTAATAVTATAATYSIYVKQGTGATTANVFGLYNSTTATTLVLGTLNFSTGVWTYSTGSTGVIVQNVGNGWWRLCISASSGITSGDSVLGWLGWTGGAATAGDYYYAYGVQIEAGAFATSYIPTTSAQVARNVDSVTSSSISSWYNQSAGTALVQADTIVPNGTVNSFPGQFQFDDGTSTNRIGDFVNAPVNNAVSLRRDVASVSLSTATVNATTPGLTFKCANAWTTSLLTMALNGGTVASVANTALPTVNRLVLGRYDSYLNGHISYFAYYPYALPSAQLQTLSAATTALPAYSLNFLTTTTLDPSLTFTRGSTAQYYNQSGLLTSNENLFLYSQDFTQSFWTKTTSTVTSSATTAPDGTSTGTKFIPNNGASSNAYLSQQLTITSGNYYCISFYAKPAGFRYMEVNGDAISGRIPVTAYFDLQNGVVTQLSGGTASIQSVGNGWFRCVAIGLSSSTVTQPFIRCSANGTTAATGDGTSGVYIWGAQMQQGTQVSVYNPTTSAAVYGPRFDYDPNPTTAIQQNLLPYSIWPGASGGPGTYPTGWANVGNNPTSVSLTQGVVNGVSTGIVIYRRITGGSGFEGLYPNNPGIPNYGAGTVLTVSVWVRVPAGVTATDLAYYDGVNTVVIVNAATLTASGATWTYYTKTITSTGTSINAGALISNNPQGVGTGFDLALPQLCFGSVALPYLATTTAAQTICAPKGLLIEQSSQNLLIQSNFASGWSVTAVTLSPNTVTSPDGSADANTITATAGFSTHQTQSTAFAATSGTTYTYSVYLKAGTNRYVQIPINSTILSTNAYANFDLVAGTVTASSGLTASIFSVGNGWYRCVTTFTANITASAGVFVWLASTATDGFAVSFTAAGTETVYVYGAQVEALAFPTSYMPTAAATATRNAETTSINSASFNSWFLQGRGTFTVAYDTSFYGNTPAAFTVTSASGFNITGSGAAQWWNGSTNIFTPNTASVNTVRKEAFAYAPYSRTLCLNAGTPGQDASYPFSGTVVTMNLGTAYGTAQWINGHIRTFSYYSTQFNTIQLQQATT